MSKPIAVIVADVHYGIHTIALANAGMRQAIKMANKLNVPLVVAGDLHDTKANLRGECIKAMLDTFEFCKITPIVITGNHCLINEKSKDNSLEFLRKSVSLVSKAFVHSTLGYLIPYHSDPDELRRYLEAVPKGSRIIMHQGVQGSNMGDYVVDKSALTKEDLASYRVIGGHYHTRQTIPLPQGGVFDYVGNLFTLGFGEANDPEKGFQILNNDGSLEFVPTNLRKHVIYDVTFEQFLTLQYKHSVQDLVWVKVRGTKEQLAIIHSTPGTSRSHFKGANIKLDLIPLDQETQEPSKADSMSQTDLLDSMIDSMANTADETKARLKDLWRTCASN